MSLSTYMWRKDAQGNNLLFHVQTRYRPRSARPGSRLRLSRTPRRRMSTSTSGTQGWTFWYLNIWGTRDPLCQRRWYGTGTGTRILQVGTIVRWQRYWLLYLTLIGLRCRAGHWYLDTGTVLCTIGMVPVQCTVQYVYCECISSLVDYYLFRTFFTQGRSKSVKFGIVPVPKSYLISDYRILLTLPWTYVLSIVYLL